LSYGHRHKNEKCHRKTEESASGTLNGQTTKYNKIQQLTTSTTPKKHKNQQTGSLVGVTREYLLLYKLILWPNNLYHLPYSLFNKNTEST